jgi:hypothetical protein
MVAQRTEHYHLLSKLRTRDDLSLVLHHLSIFSKRVDTIISHLENNMEIAGVVPGIDNHVTILTEDETSHAVEHHVLFPIDYPRHPFLLTNSQLDKPRPFKDIGGLVEYIISQESE